MIGSGAGLWSLSARWLPLTLLVYSISAKNTAQNSRNIGHHARSETTEHCPDLLGWGPKIARSTTSRSALCSRLFSRHAAQASFTNPSIQPGYSRLPNCYIQVLPPQISPRREPGCPVFGHCELAKRVCRRRSSRSHEQLGSQLLWALARATGFFLTRLRFGLSFSAVIRGQLKPGAAKARSAAVGLL